MKRIIKFSSVLLAISMLLAMLPAGAYASTDAWDGTSIDVTWYNTNATQFTIMTPAQLAGLAAIVNGTEEGIEKDSFAGKTVKLGADIDLGGKNWTPIGRRTGSSTYDPFAGVFDGCGHTISNLSITYDITGQMYNGQPIAFVGCVGLFGYTEGIAQNRVEIKNVTLIGTLIISSETGNTATSIFGFAGLVGVTKNTDITDCIVDVDVTDNSNTTRNVQYIGGIVGLGYTLNIERCINLGNIRCNAPKDRYIGGLVGGLQTPPYIIKDCCNKGEVSVSASIDPNFGYTAGLVGYLSLGKSEGVDTSYICNCFNTGTITGGTQGNSMTFNAALVAYIINQYTLHVENNYYLESSCEKAIGFIGSNEVNIPSIAKTIDELTAAEFITTLNTSGNGAWKLGLTYPILVCQPDEVPPGDITRSGSVDENDVTHLIGHILGTNPLDPHLAGVGDMNRDSLIDENDVTYLTQTVMTAD